MRGSIHYKSISEIGVKEKYLRSNHYNTIKTWWARRPITTVRSLMIKEVLKRARIENEPIDIELFTNINPSNSAFQSFKEEFRTEQLSLLDVFSGGGAIPFESARLGFQTHSAELNPVATLLQETIFNSQGIDNYAEKLREAGYNVINKAKNRLSKYFDINNTNPYVIFWSKVAKCKNCATDLDLRRFEYLSKREKKPLRIIEGQEGLAIENTFGEEEGLSKEFICKECKTSHSFKDIQEFCQSNSFSYSPFAMCYHKNSKKEYKIISIDDKQIFEELQEGVENDIQQLNHLVATEKVKAKKGVINPTIYDLKRAKDFFSSRQLLVLITVIDEIVKEYGELEGKYDETEAKQIVLGLTSLIEFLVDWNSVSTMWISQNEQTGRSLAGPGVGMKWDFIEINPFYNNGSNLKSKIDRVCDTFQSIQFLNPINIINGSSTKLPIPDKSIDIVLTDPPYYDSIDYTGLSEFFRPWFEILIRNTFNNTIDLKNQDEFEAIVELSKSDNPKNHNHYKIIMSGVLAEVNRVLKDDGSVLLMYSHKTIEGWQVIAEAYRSANLFISECIPLEMERSARPRAMAYEALNGVIVFRATKNNYSITTIQQDIEGIKEKIASGDMLESQVVIYLASLACKEVTLTGKSYNECYSHVVKLYQHTLIDKWLKNDMDKVTIAYLEARLKDSLNELQNEYIDTLNSYELIKKNKIKDMDEIDANGKLKTTVFGLAKNIYNEFKYNSKTKITVDINKKESITAFFSILAGTQLNTVSKRSSNTETKTARLVLSKLV